MALTSGPLATVVLSMMDQNPAARPDMETLSARLARIAASGADEAGPDVAPTTIDAAAAGVAVGLADTVPAAASPGGTRVISTNGPDAGDPDSDPAANPDSDPAANPAADATADATADPTVAMAAPAAPTSALPAAIPARSPSQALVGGSPGEARRGRHRVLVPLVAALVAVAAAVAAYHLAGPDGTPSAGRTPSNGTSVSSPPTTRPATTTTATPSRSSSTSSSPTSTSSTPRRPASGDTDEALASMVMSYFADVTRDRDLTWTQLTPRMQRAAHGRAGYDGFWSTIRSVALSDVKADAKKRRLDATLTYTRRDGSTSTEKHRFDMVRQGDAFLIDGDHRR
jgi:hypothetical protein